MTISSLESLGGNKFGRIVEQLKRGVSACLLAQLIRDHWGDCNDLPEDTLIDELEWLRKCLTATLDPAEQSTEDDKLGLEILQSSGDGCLDQLAQLAIISRRRLKRLLEREESTGCTQEMIDGCKKLLEATQAMKFDLGVDKLMRSTPEKLWLEIERLKREQEQSERQCVIAYAEAERIFERLEKRREIGGRDTRAVEVPSETLSSGDGTN